MMKWGPQIYMDCKDIYIYKYINVLVMMKSGFQIWTVKMYIYIYIYIYKVLVMMKWGFHIYIYTHRHTRFNYDEVGSPDMDWKGEGKFIPAIN
jgi:hypothetical protein